MSAVLTHGASAGTGLQRRKHERPELRISSKQSEPRQPTRRLGTSLPIATGQPVKIGQSTSDEGTRAVDAVVTRFGVNRHYERIVWETGGEGYDVTNASGGVDSHHQWVVVDYFDPRRGGPAKSGVQVWIQETTKLYFVIGKSILRLADQRLIALGADLTLYTRHISLVAVGYKLQYGSRLGRGEYLDNFVDVFIWKEKRGYRLVVQ